MANIDMCEHDWPGSGCRKCFPKPDENARLAQELKTVLAAGTESEMADFLGDNAGAILAALGLKQAADTLEATRANQRNEVVEECKRVALKAITCGGYGVRNFEVVIAQDVERALSALAKEQNDD